MSNLEEKTQFLRELVEINSGTHNPSGVLEVQKVVAEHLRKMKVDYSFESSPAAGGKILVAEVRAASPIRPEFITLVTHADTVFELDSGFLDFKLNEKVGTASGPGIIDDKGGIVVALAGLERAFKSGHNLRFICTPSEEIGSPGFHPLFKKFSQDSWMILGFEPSMDDGSIVGGRRGNRWYHIQVHGCEAHAGRGHAQGVNAAHELAHKITELHHMTDYSKDLTVNVGQISGGSKYNVVCGHADAKVDVRFSDLKIREKAHCEIESIVAKSYVQPNSEGKLPTSKFEITDDCPPFSSAGGTQAFLESYLALIEKVEGKKVNAIKSGGSADSNYMSRDGLIILDGLGPTGGGIHSKNEWIRLSSLETRTECFYRFLTEVCKDENFKKDGKVSKRS